MGRCIFFHAAAVYAASFCAAKPFPAVGEGCRKKSRMQWLTEAETFNRRPDAGDHWVRDKR